MALISMAQWAKKQGFSRQYAHQLIQSGIISRIDGKIDEDQANAALIEKRELTRPQYRKDDSSAAPQNAKGLNQLWLKTRIKNAMQKGEALAFENSVRKGEMIPVADVDEAAFRCARVTRDRLLTIPARVCHELASIGDAAEIESRLTTEIRQALEQLSHPRFSLESGTKKPVSSVPMTGDGDEDSHTKAYDPLDEEGL
jgi:hypothetical protein